MRIIETNLLNGRRYSQPARDQRLRHNIKEELYWVDHQTHQLKILSGTEDHVDIPLGIDESFRDAWTTHNHPNNSPPSIPDFLTSASWNVKGFRVLSPDFTYIVERLGSKWHPSLTCSLIPLGRSWIENAKFILTGGKYGERYRSHDINHPFSVAVDRREDKLKSECDKSRSWDSPWDDRAQALSDLSEKYGYKFTKIRNPANYMAIEASDLSLQGKYQEADQIFGKAQEIDPHNYLIDQMKASDTSFRGEVARIKGAKEEASALFRKALTTYQIALSKAKASNHGFKNSLVLEQIQRSISDLEKKLWS